MTKKKPRLFVYSDKFTDGTHWHCGGPGVNDALTGLVNVLKDQIAQVLDGRAEAIDITLTCSRMTDKQIRNLPDPS
jgi:hypothetical protein